MKNSAYAILLIFLILATGCSNTATPADDKAFYDKANSAGLSIAENFENKIELAIESGDYDAAALICNQAGSQYSELADDLEKMPVTENMASVKKEYVSGYRSFQQAMVAGTDVAKYSKINDTKKAGASYEIVTMNTDAAKTHFVAAKTLYGNLVKLTITTTPTPKSGYIISISHPYSWEGNYGDTDSQKSINGQNGKEIPIDHISGALSIVVQKKGGDSETLKVEILKDGKVIKSVSTDSPHGAVSLTYSPGWLG